MRIPVSSEGAGLESGVGMTMDNLAQPRLKRAEIVLPVSFEDMPFVNFLIILVIASDVLQQSFRHALHTFGVEYAMNLAALGEADGAHVVHLPVGPRSILDRAGHIFLIVME